MRAVALLVALISAAPAAGQSVVSSPAPERVAAMILLGNALAVLFVPLGLALALPGQ